MSLTVDQQAQLDRDGWTILENVLDADHLERVRQAVEAQYEAEGENAGSEFRTESGARRLANLVDKGQIFGDLLVDPQVLDGVRHVLGEEFKLSSFNARSANPHSGEAQPLHCDAGAIPDEKGDWVCNTIWLLDDFTLDNGPTRVVSGSHRWKQLPTEVLEDPQAPHPDEQLITGPAGSVVVMNTHAWHGGTANNTDTERRALHGFFCRSDKPQQQYQKKLLSAETQASLSPELRALTAIDDPRNDELSAGEEMTSGFMK